MKKRIISFFIMLLLIFTMAAPSFSLYAEQEDEEQQETETPESTEKEAFFADIEEGDLFLVSIEWENSRPTVKFRSPSGVIYDTAIIKEGTHISEGEGELYYQIDEPEVGEWYVIYDKKDNDSISIDLQEATKPFVVEAVTVSGITGNGANVSFKVAYDGSVFFSYKISIVATAGNSGEVVYEGSGYTNEEVQAYVDLQKFGSYSEYRVYVYAYYFRDGVEIGEGAYSEKFSYNNSNINDMQTPVKLTVLPDELTLTIDFEKSYRYSYLISYYLDDKTEPDSYLEVEEDDKKSIDYVYDINAKKVKVEIYEKSGNGPYSNPKTYTINLAKLPLITFDSLELTNKRFIAYSYSGFEPKTMISIAVNSTKGDYILNAAEGSMTAALNDTYNAVSVSYNYEKDVAVTYKKEIYMDLEAPRIYMLQDYTDVKTNGQSYNVLGTVTGASVFTIDGKEVTLNSDGTFAHALQLKKGENVFVAEAKDPAGNISVYTITITCANVAPTPTPVGGNGGNSSQIPQESPSASFLSFLPAVIATVLGVVLLVLLAVFGKKQKETSLLGNIRKIVAFVGLLGFIFTGYSTYNFVKTNLFVNSTKFIDLAYSSIDEANEYLSQLSFWKTLTICGAVELGACVVAIIAITVIKVLKKKKHN